MKIGISACLAGYSVRYDGKNKLNQALMDLLKDQELVFICPEVQGGLSIPRSPSEIKGGRVINRQGIDISEAYQKGSEECFEKIRDCSFVVLKSLSPACGKGLIYDGSFCGNKIDGNGIFVSYCISHQIPVFSELELDAITKMLK